LAGPNEWQQVCNRTNPEKKTGLSCEGADFSWLSLKVSRTLACLPTPTGGSERANSVHCRPPPVGVDKVLITMRLMHYGVGNFLGVMPLLLIIVFPYKINNIHLEICSFFC
jgi:hypothetical protein